MSRPHKARWGCSAWRAVCAWTLHRWTLASGSDTPPCAGMDAKPTSFESTDPSVATRVLGYRLWPAILVTFLTGTGFAGLKFVLINEIALAYDKAHPPDLPFHWMETILDRCVQENTLKDAVSQGLAAVLTLGVLLGYALNAPLASAWRCSRLFVISCAGVAAGTLLTLWGNVWLVVWLVGMAYGAACAARGKVVPLLSVATGRASTQVSGFINAALVIGLLAGTVFGNVLGSYVGVSATRHYVLFAFMALATVLSLLVRPPEPRRIPFAVGMRDPRRRAPPPCSSSTGRPCWSAAGLAWGIALGREPRGVRRRHQSRAPIAPGPDPHLRQLPVGVRRHRRHRRQPGLALLGPPPPRHRQPDRARGLRRRLSACHPHLVAGVGDDGRGGRVVRRPGQRAGRAPARGRRLPRRPGGSRLHRHEAWCTTSSSSWSAAAWRCRCSWARSPRARCSPCSAPPPWWRPRWSRARGCAIAAAIRSSPCRAPPPRPSPRRSRGVADWTACRAASGHPGQAGSVALGLSGGRCRTTRARRSRLWAGRGLPSGIPPPVKPESTGDHAADGLPGLGVLRVGFRAHALLELVAADLLGVVGDRLVDVGRHASSLAARRRGKAPAASSEAVPPRTAATRAVPARQQLGAGGGEQRADLHGRARGQLDRDPRRPEPGGVELARQLDRAHRAVDPGRVLDRGELLGALDLEERRARALGLPAGMRSKIGARSISSSRHLGGPRRSTRP